MGRAIYIVMTAGPVPLLLGAYHYSVLAQTHARLITGASVTAMEVFSTLPEEVVDDLAGEYAEEEDTPVVPMPITIALDEIDE